jgi:hypothetical protein
MRKTLEELENDEDIALGKHSYEILVTYYKAGHSAAETDTRYKVSMNTVQRAIVALGARGIHRRGVRPEHYYAALPVEITRICKKCGNEKAINQFALWYKNTGRARRRICMDCANFSTYGITDQQYREMLVEQNGKCAICKKPPTDRRLAVDHCHTTGKVRGLLCMKCNTGLGHFEDNLKFLEEAQEYLRKATV